MFQVCSTARDIGMTDAAMPLESHLSDPYLLITALPAVCPVASGCEFVLLNPAAFSASPPGPSRLATISLFSVSEFVPLVS